MTDSIEKKLSDCGCCGDKLPQVNHYNRPGQPTLAYRLGIHATFLRRMLEGLPFQEIAEGNNRARPLAKLTTRERDDPSIAFLDAWATVADVLTFYQERIINEGYLRTATERRSVLELARAIGYELNPGVAGSTYLAFTVEDVLGAPGVAIVPKGARVQSIPPQDKMPQTFETIEEITARAEWNALRPRMTRPQELAIIKPKKTILPYEIYEIFENLEINRTADVYLLGINTRFPLNTPNAIEVQADIVYPLEATIVKKEIPAIGIQHVYLKGTSSNIKAGDLLLFVGKSSAEDIKTVILRIKLIEVEMEMNRTRIDIDTADEDVKPWFPPFMPPELKSANPGEVASFSKEKVDEFIRGQTWNESDLYSFITMNNWNAKDLLTNIATQQAADISSEDHGIFVFRQRVSFFGHNAQRWETLPNPNNTRGRGDTNKDPYRSPWSDNNTIWYDSQCQLYPDDVDVYLERTVPEILNKSWVIFETADGTRRAYRVCSSIEVSLVDYGISGRATGLKLKEADGSEQRDKITSFKVRKTTAYVQSERLELADIPIEDQIEEIEQTDQIKKGASSLMLNRLVLGLKVGQPLVLRGEQCDAPGVIRHEVIFLNDIKHIGGYTTLYFNTITDGKESNRLQYRYVRKTVTLNANVALATHGETVREVLGSGDGSRMNQRFVLKKPPLTYVPATTPSGAESTLEVHVNDVLWKEVPSLYGIDECSQNYIVRIDNDARVMVLFGDGKSGARLPSGTENVVAVYRSGIGLDGEVDAGSLTLLQTRPLGIREVTNPLPATGADDPEKLDMARTNAPRTVLTFDRIVSLQDFEDFSRSFAGIGKARAVALWDGEKRIVHITVAGASGKTIDDKLRNNLVEAIKASCDPFQPVKVADFIKTTFSIEARLLVDERYIYEDVKKQVERALSETFTFEKRDFGQPVTAAEVLTVIQAVEGIIAVDLEKLMKDCVDFGLTYEDFQRTSLMESVYSFIQESKIDMKQPTTSSGNFIAPIEKTIKTPGILSIKVEEAMLELLPPAILTANTARRENGQIKLAELLLINPTGITLKKMGDMP